MQGRSPHLPSSTVVPLSLSALKFNCRLQFKMRLYPRSGKSRRCQPSLVRARRSSAAKYDFNHFPISQRLFDPVLTLAQVSGQKILDSSMANLLADSSSKDLIGNARSAEPFGSDSENHAIAPSRHRAFVSGHPLP